MPDRLEILIDHAAELQQEIDRLDQEIMFLVLGCLGLSLLLASLMWKQWQAE